jgi:hypothetical protein
MPSAYTTSQTTKDENGLHVGLQAYQLSNDCTPQFTEEDTTLNDIKMYIEGILKDNDSYGYTEEVDEYCRRLVADKAITNHEHYAILIILSEIKDTKNNLHHLRAEFQNIHREEDVTPMLRTKAVLVLNAWSNQEDCLNDLCDLTHS